MNAKNELCLGMLGAGRASELHLEALKRFSTIPLCLKHIVARRKEQVEAMKRRFGFLKSSFEFEDLLNDDEIDVIDICTPPYNHEEAIIKVLKAGKSVICEKPLTGYFGEKEDALPIGKMVSKTKMYDKCLLCITRLEKSIKEAQRKNPKIKFCYAENFIYAPALSKIAQIISAKRSKILYAKGEESLKGSSSAVAGEWAKTGGGTFIRTGAHPLSALLWLKKIEGKARGEDIRVKSVLADMMQVTPTLSKYEHRHIAATPNDVEDGATVILTFTDGTKAVIIATDTLLGGSKNTLELYCNDAAIKCKLTMNDMLSTYFLDEDGLEDVEISEMLPSKTGWNNPFLEDIIIRGYVDEMRDFMECIYYDKEVKSGFEMASESIKIIYAAYKSAQLGRAVEL